MDPQEDMGNDEVFIWVDETAQLPTQDRTEEAVLPSNYANTPEQSRPLAETHPLAETRPPAETPLGPSPLDAFIAFKKDTTLPTIGDMMLHLETACLIPREDLQAEGFDPAMLMVCPFPGTGGQKVFLSLEAARWLVRGIVQIEKDGGFEGVKKKSDKKLEAETDRAYQSFKKALALVFDWPDYDPHIGVTSNREIRSQMFEETAWQRGKVRLARYVPERRALWGKLCADPEAKMMLTTNPPWPIAGAPAFAVEAMKTSFDAHILPLVRLWIAGYVFLDTGVALTDASITLSMHTKENFLGKGNNQ